ncbi:3-phytase [Rippkaea orientalis PCC 8801]|uniref:3-phytase n=1 Tax=Rippkaea orientalis (strain PCC 8801 / RF-1) TaxID=41431 RepID=B7K675_RIPO1|nr:phytase [Rippkaea orientalis]ACK68128.1 3-phytase [Rippkaea orientalis PCC 8801]
MNKIINSLAVACFSFAFSHQAAIAVQLATPTAETPPVIDEIVDPPGDADDPAIWLHPNDPSQSLVLGTLKNAGLGVYDLGGNLLQLIQPNSIRYNNVDLLYGFSLGGNSVDLAIASDRQNDILAIFKIDPMTRLLESIVSNNIGTIFTPVGQVSNGTTTAYGLATYTDLSTGKNYVFVSQRETGNVAQLELFDDGTGKVNYTQVRSLTLPIPPGGVLEDAQVEGMVADRELGYVYVGQENRGIWKFSASPNGSTLGQLIDAVKPEGTHLEADVEGLTIYYSDNGTGYLLASSQGDNTFAIYDRLGNNNYLGSFSIVASGGIDSVEESDGADVINVPLGSQFPFGLFVTQDGSNDPPELFFDPDDQEFVNVSSNFKFVPWETIANAFAPNPLLINTSSFDPRNPSSITVPEPTLSIWGLFVMLGVGYLKRGKNHPFR